MVPQHFSSRPESTEGEPEHLSHEQRMRRAALLSLCDPVSPVCVEEFKALSGWQWKRLLRWLHLSGLALTFFDRMLELQWGELLPAWAVAQLQRNVTDNRERTCGMLVESVEIQREFQGAGIRYAVLKGVSLWPSSFSKPELRLQFDLDFLLAESDIAEARGILERRGYRLYGAHGRSWEFKRNERPGLTLKDVYRNTGSWLVELHAESRARARPSLLEQLHWRDLFGFRMPVLAPVDLFLGQGLHAYKHVCGEFARAGFLVEFRWHVVFRSDDIAFWSDLHARMGDDQHAQIGLGIATLLISGAMGDFAPEEMKRWTVDSVPQVARMWCRRYGNRIVLGSYPGSKLALLLKQALGERSESTGRPMRKVLLPLCAPLPAIRAFPQETLSVRAGRYGMRIAQFTGRLRFHIVEGLRFWWEWHMWRRVSRSAQ